MYFQPNSTGEQKTKPTQNSVRELRGLGLSPDLVSLYSLYVVKSQSMSSHSSSENFFFFFCRLFVVAQLHWTLLSKRKSPCFAMWNLNRWSVYMTCPPSTEYLYSWRIRASLTTSTTGWTSPLWWDLEKCSQSGRRCQTGLHPPNSPKKTAIFWQFQGCCSCFEWPVFLLHRSDRLLEQTSIALVGKYTKLSDSYASVIKALEHSALAINYKLEVKVRNDSH